MLDKTKVHLYLAAHYGLKDSQIDALMTKYHSEVADGIRWNSGAYYVAGQMADAEGIAHPEPCAACEAEEKAELEAD